jgi:DnaJ-class molecular chaperone
MVRFKKLPALPCTRCYGAGRVQCHKAVVGKGWKVSGITCPTCGGRGKLPTR